MTDIDALVKQAIAAWIRMSSEEKRALRREQAISFVYGNLAIENDRITREMVEKAWEDYYK